MTRPRVIAVSDAGRPCGEDAPRAVRTAADVERLRALVAAGVPLATAARALGIPRRSARDYAEGRTWGAPAGWRVLRARPEKLC